jgi:tRNA pseudouridine38-40 synthase
LADRNHRMELQYDGTGLHGWAKQDGLPSVEGCLEEALRTVVGRAPQLHVAGRTDAGVHARRQVVSLSLPDGLDPAKLRRSLNALTPPGIAVLDLRPAPPEFDARRDATGRCYRYFLSTQPVVSPFWVRYCWQVPPGGLDLAAMSAVATLVVGRHRFTAFTPAETEHVFFDRTVRRCRWRRVSGGGSAGRVGPIAPVAASLAGRQGGSLLCLEIEADALLRHMVRTLVGTMVEVGRGERSPDDFDLLLDGAPREAAGPTAPAQGLFLWDIRYGRRTRSAAVEAAPSAGRRAVGKSLLIRESADSEA